MSPYSGYLVETCVTLGGVCALAVAVLWAARRMGVVRSSGPIELRGHLPLDARRAIYLVKVGAVVFIVGVGEAGMTKLGEMADADLPTTGRPRGVTFAQVFARMRGETRRSGAPGERDRIAAADGEAARSATAVQRGAVLDGRTDEP